MEIVVSHPIDDVSFGVGVRMLDGTALLFAHHDDHGASSRWRLEPGTFVLQFTLGNDLQPGIYKLCVGAHSQIHTNSLFHLEAASLEVLEHSADGSTPLVYNRGVVNGYLTCERPRKLSEPLQLDSVIACKNRIAVWRQQSCPTSRESYPEIVGIDIVAPQKDQALIVLGDLADHEGIRQMSLYHTPFSSQQEMTSPTVCILAGAQILEYTCHETQTWSSPYMTAMEPYPREPKTLTGAKSTGSSTIKMDTP